MYRDDTRFHASSEAPHIDSGELPVVPDVIDFADLWALRED
jgi:hypothetical protein